jgi:Zn-finger nucleic acid-binding protein
MAGPYRDPDLVCPACHAQLRVFRQRLCCDACNGILLEIADLTTSISDLTGSDPQIGFVRERPGERACPRCDLMMSVCRLDVALMDKRPTLRPALDRCVTHGVWFDANELAKVFEVLHRAVSPHGYRASPMNEIGRY